MKVKMQVSQLWYQQRHCPFSAFPQQMWVQGSGRDVWLSPLPAPVPGEGTAGQTGDTSAGAMGTSGISAPNTQPAGTRHSSLVFLGLMPSVTIFVTL